MLDIVQNCSIRNITELINTSYEVYRYIICSASLLRLLLYLQVSQTPGSYISPTGPGTKFLIHMKHTVKQQSLYKIWIFWEKLDQHIMLLSEHYLLLMCEITSRSQLQKMPVFRDVTPRGLAENFQFRTKPITPSSGHKRLVSVHSKYTASHPRRR
jgi:hypothetical protein